MAAKPDPEPASSAILDQALHLIDTQRTLVGILVHPDPDTPLVVLSLARPLTHAERGLVYNSDPILRCAAGIDALRQMARIYHARPEP